MLATGTYVTMTHLTQQKVLTARLPEAALALSPMFRTRITVAGAALNNLSRQVIVFGRAAPTGAGTRVAKPLLRNRYNEVIDAGAARALRAKINMLLASPPAAHVARV
jgi:hypothetical protein